MEPIPPINRRENAVRRVERVQRVRLLTPQEREEARRERERLRSERNSSQEHEGPADHRA
jgi:hypothetical protein